MLENKVEVQLISFELSESSKRTVGYLPSCAGPSMSTIMFWGVFLLLLHMAVVSQAAACSFCQSSAGLAFYMAA